MSLSVLYVDDFCFLCSLPVLVENNSQERKCRKSSFDRKGSSGQSQQVQEQPTPPEYEKCWW